jgi:hypothetical protein
MNHNRYRNVPCAYCGENIAQANRPHGEAMHRRCKTLRRNPVGFLPAGSKRGISQFHPVEVVECVWCCKPKSRRAYIRSAPTCSDLCKAAWTRYLRGATSSNWPKPYKSRSAKVWFGQCTNCSLWMRFRTAKQKFCTPQCASQFAHKNGLSLQTKRPVYFHHCTDCSKLFCARARSQVTCPPCKSLRVYQDQQFQSKVSLLIPYIGDRDKWTCQICKRNVRSRTYSSGDRHSPTIDHVVPKSEARALGWSEREIHALSNLRLAHMICNAVRNNGGGGEQLALVG